MALSFSKFVAFNFVDEPISRDILPTLSTAGAAIRADDLIRTLDTPQAFLAVAGKPVICYSDDLLAVTSAIVAYTYRLAGLVPREDYPEHKAAKRAALDLFWLIAAEEYPNCPKTRTLIAIDLLCLAMIEPDVNRRITTLRRANAVSGFDHESVGLRISACLATALDEARQFGEAARVRKDAQSKYATLKDWVTYRTTILLEH